MLVSVAELKTYMDISLSLRQEDAADLILGGLQSELESYLRRPIEPIEFVNEVHVLESDHIGLPLGSTFYNEGYQQTDINPNGIVTYSTPPPTIYLRNSPVVSVKSVIVGNLSTDGLLLGEAIKRTAVITRAVVYTATNDFTVGQTVDIQGMSYAALNLDLKVISAVTSTTFTVSQSGLTAGTYNQTGSADARGSDYTVRRYGIDFYRGYANDRVTVTYTAGLDGENIKMFKLMILRAATREMQNMHDDVVGVKDLNPRGVAVAETGFLEKELMMVKRYRRNRIA
jgi:hypothetical protein